MVVPGWIIQEIHTVGGEIECASDHNMGVFECGLSPCGMSIPGHLFHALD